MEKTNFKSLLGVTFSLVMLVAATGPFTSQVVEATSATTYTRTINSDGIVIRCQDGYLPETTYDRIGLDAPQDMVTDVVIENGKEVGYILRNISSSGSKYYNQIPPNYMYNFDIGFTRKINVITEGVLDAIAINGIGLLGNTVSFEKKDKIKSLMQRSKVIYIPDKDKAGLNAINDFMKYGLNDIYISCPDWDTGIKDPFDAVNKYGRIYTLEMIINNATNLMVGYMKAMNWCVDSNEKLNISDHYNIGMLPR